MAVYIFQTMINQLKAFLIELEAEEIMAQMSKTLWDLRCELVQQGFSTREAMEIVKAFGHGIVGGKL